ncbi:Uncharacterised protein [Mycolicibacterium aurum]|uniref:DUF7159 domain-containing protein n=1 Tax=Mycolicibacterium aurum TaxID=1791 RepID=A0A448ITC8_MYCAU|nr:hypothetical protein [Mycolicibacterium aurum]VEG55597.1 Uncharacterised protein [Mycolicibacterium aurum]
MRVVLGLSLTAASAVWVLVDTYDGRIIADEVVQLESLNEIARAAARSVQAFALQSDEDIDGVRLVWTDDARQHGIRLRTKLRLFGFETVETVTEDAAREGRNRTARHIAPHMVMAYGAARADLDDTDDRNVLRRLAARVPLSLRVPTGVPVRLAAAASVAALAIIGVGLYSFVGHSPSPAVTDTSVAGAVVPDAPAAPAPAAIPAAPIPAELPAVPQAVTVPEPTVAVEVPDTSQMMPEYASAPTVVDDTETYVPDVTSVADAVEAPALDSVHGAAEAASPAQLATIAGSPHLSGAGPAAGPQPVAVPGQATPALVQPSEPAPAGPLGALFGALP